MIKSFFFLFTLCVSLCTIDTSAQQNFKSNLSTEELRNAPVKLIPFPKQIEWGSTPITYENLDLLNGDLISVNIQEELKNVLDEGKIALAKGANNTLEFIQLDSLSQEAYILEIEAGKINISASTESGFFYALQSLRQLFVGDRQIYPVKIWDEPAFEIRGYMIDVGRNFQTLEALKDQIDIMASYKLNTFHWHLTDYPAWRIESKKYPELTAAENHRPTRDPGKFYTYNEIRDLINYANRLQIQVIPEIDMPGHSTSFATATGHKMESEEGIVILEDVLNEFFKEIPIEMAPIIHIGSDEIKIPDPEGFMNRMLGVLAENQREAVVWDPGLPAHDKVIRQTWKPEHEIEVVEKSDLREIDSQNYINNSEPMLQIPHILFKPIGRDSPNKVLGGIIALWPDVNLNEGFDAVRQNPLYPSLLAYAWTTWTADITEASTDYITRVPQIGTKEHEYFAVFEDYLMFHKQKHFRDLPFQYVRQANTVWKLIGPFENKETLSEIKKEYKSGDSIVTWKNATGNTIYIRDRFKQGGYYPQAKPGETYFAHTYIYAEKDTELPVWIGFETPFRSNRAFTGIAKEGQWDINGGNVWVNGQEVQAPKWENPGWKPQKTSGWGSAEDQEVPWSDEELYWTREPARVSLKQGWNEVLIRVPGTNDYQNWMFTFAPLDDNNIKFLTSKD